MYAILMSFLAGALTWLVRAILIKAVFYFALFYVATEGIAYLAQYLTANNENMSAGGISALLANTTPAVKYFLQMFRFDVGLPAILSAFVLRFAVRRLPVIG